MLQLKNHSPFAPAICLLPNLEGVDTLFVIVRGSFALRPQLKLADEALPPVLADEYWGEPGRSSLKYPSELHVGKPGTDVALIGHAWAPGGRRATESLVAVQVAERRKIIKVFGDRTWKSGGIGSPQPFERLPLHYERAFGGRHVDGDRVLGAEERNPVGVGFLGKRAASELVGHNAPNFEDPARLLTKPGESVDPAGFGFIAGHWLPRRARAGTYDTAWQAKRAPYLPLDFDPRFLSCATPELAFDRFLSGREPVVVQGADRAGMIRFALPACHLRISVKLAGKTQTPQARLETVLIEPDDNRLSLSWRASLSCDKQALKIEEVAVMLDELDLGAGPA
jgi:hypothetical protein